MDAHRRTRRGLPGSQAPGGSRRRYTNTSGPPDVNRLTLPLPAPDGSGALAVALDLRTHQVVAEHSDGRAERVALTPDRPVADVTREVLAAVRALAGPVQINPRPQEVPWSTPLDQDEEHATHDPAHVSAYFAAATRAALVLSALRAPYRGRCSPVNAWWGSFDLAVSLFSDRPAEPASGGFIMRNAGTPSRSRSVVARRRALPAGGLLRVRRSRASGICGRDAVPGGRPLGRRAGRIRARLGRRPRQRESAPGRAGVRPVLGPACVRGLRLGSGAGCQRAGRTPATRLTGRQPGGRAPSSRRTTLRSARTHQPAPQGRRHLAGPAGWDKLAGTNGSRNPPPMTLTEIPSRRSR